MSGSRSGEKEFPLVRAAMWVGLMALSALALVWPHLEMVKLGYELTRLDAERDRLGQGGPGLPGGGGPPPPL